MKEDKRLPKSLYDVVSELVTFIDDVDYERKEKNSKDSKQYIENLNKNINLKNKLI